METETEIKVHGHCDLLRNEVSMTEIKGVTQECDFRETIVEWGNGDEEKSCRSCAALRLYIPVWGVMVII